jgi:trk system potassium uptake protein TrkH
MTETRCPARGSHATTGLLWRTGAGVLGSLRDAAFTVASIGTSLGYVTTDYDQWPDLARFPLILLMFTGASAGSTSGGIKVLRVLLLLKMLQRQLRKLVHPRAVIPVRVGRKVIPEEALLNVTAFFFAFLTIWLVGAAFIIATDPKLDLFDGAVAAASAMGNTGPAMGVVGPTQTFEPLMASSKVVLALLMWFGRLELFAALLVFLPSSWKN